MISLICTTRASLHRLDLPDMNPIGLSAQKEELGAINLLWKIIN
jgi:hypothetical protein